jgi:outer membrane protein
MKKSIIAILMLGTAFTASADVVLGADVELNYWNQDSTFESTDQGSEASLFGSISFEHVIPLVPNIKYSFTSIDNDAFEYSKQDATLYYEILDNDIISVDLGVGVTHFGSGQIKALSGLPVNDFEGVLPHIYAGAEIGIPMTGVTFYTDVSSTMINDSSVLDAAVGVRYDISLVAVEIGLQAGYKVVEFDMDDFDDLSFNMKTDGFYAGINLDF